MTDIEGDRVIYLRHEVSFRQCLVQADGCALALPADEALCGVDEKASSLLGALHLADGN
jgi:hypothetical protein